jgi:uncharacterized RDD family membrane protein YckC
VSGYEKYLHRKEAGDQLALLTPEGIPLNFTVARGGDRAAAFIIDFLIQMAVVILLVILLAQFGLGDGGGFAAAFVTLAAFFITTFYWTWFEIRWQGATPAKRWLGIRVIDRHGGQLTSEAVIARNLTRQIEVMWPLLFLLAPEALWPDAPPWGRVLAGAWILVLAFFPLFNKQRLRVGDMIAGTLVVLAPRTVLLADIGDRAGAGPAPWSPPGAAAASPPAPAYTFTDKQLDVYGIYELQVLEQVLRQAESGQAEAFMALDTVAEKIKVKIDWPRNTWAVDNERFLREFYAALRARLEHRMLLGERKADKFSR